MENMRGYRGVRETNKVNGVSGREVRFRWGDVDYSWRNPTRVGSISPYCFEYDSFIVDEMKLGRGEYRLLDVDHRLILPLRRSLLRVSSADVIHRWSVPAIGVKIDAVPGKHNILLLEPSRCGVYYGQCSELCGVNHSFMPIVVEIINRNFFARWVAYTD